MTIKNLKKSNGFAASDALIAVLIIALFTGIIATIIYNIYLSNTSIKRMGTATGYVTSIFENVDKAFYEDITTAGLEIYINNNSDLFNLSSNQINISSNNTTNETAKSIGNSNSPSYSIDIYIEYYNKTKGNEDKLDLVKQLTVTARYKLGNRDQIISMKRIKSREKLVIPNNPDISLLESEQEKIYPIKKINNKWKVCDERDSNWYSYERGYWATVVISKEELKMDDEIDIDDFATEGNMYVWIPRFAYNGASNSILFLYGNTNKYVSNSGEYNSLSVLEDAFAVSTDFKTDDIGIWVNNTSGEAYTNLNSIYERQI